MYPLTKPIKLKHTSKDETLLVWGNSLLVLDLGLHVLDGIGGLDFEGDGLSGQSLDEDLHASTETENHVKGGFLVVRPSSSCTTWKQTLIMIKNK